MRISCDPNDHGFHPGAHPGTLDFLRFIVTLDGEPMPHAVTADEELGIVHIVHGTGRLIVLRGNVKIKSIH